MTADNSSLPSPKPPPWWCRLLIQRHGNGESAHPNPTPRSLCGRSCQGRCVRVLSSLMIQPRKKKLVNSTMYFSFIIFFELNAAQMMDKHPIRALPPSRTAPSYSPPSWTPIFGRLLCEKSSIGSRLRPRPHPSLYFLCHSI